MLLRLSNQRRKHRTLRTTIDPSQSRNNTATSLGNDSFGHGAIAYSHLQRSVLRVFSLDQPIRYF